jgi:flagellar protein FlbT
MTGRLKIHLKANERIFINGGVLKVDRKVSIELLNDVVFLLESHVMQQEEATTPLRQLYFIVQSMLIEPQTVSLAMQIYEQSYRLLLATFKDRDVLEGLVEVQSLIERGKAFEALKRIRGLFPIEQKLIESGAVLESEVKAVA